MPDLDALPLSAFGPVRYGLCWEDAAVLRPALAVRPGDRVLSVASAGDNTLALLLDDPAEVVALDRSPAQLACLALRLAAFATLDGPADVMALLGLRPHADRLRLYDALRPRLAPWARAYWDERRANLAAGRAAHGRFEGYFATFRRRVLPLVHPRRRRDALLAPRPDPDDRARFFAEQWDTWRWRLLFRLFFSRAAMARLGRDPAFFAHVEGGIAARLSARARHALVALEPHRNPYLHYILTGTYPDHALPEAFRPEHFDAIRQRADRVSLVCASLDEHLADTDDAMYDAFNLSDVFEYLTEQESARLFGEIVRTATPGARLAYWNLFVDRSIPDVSAFHADDARAAALHGQDRAFFYDRLCIARRS